MEFSFLLYFASLLMLPFASAAQAPRPRASPIIPAYLGTWQAGEVLVLDKGGHLVADTTHLDPEWSSKQQLPPGVRLQFTDGYDKKADMAYLEMHLFPPFPPNACRYPVLQFHTGQTVKGVPVPLQEKLSYDFHLTINHGQDVVDSFAPVGAVATSVSFFVQAGHEWNGEFFVAKDRQRMWCDVAVPVFKKGSDGVVRGDRAVAGWQVYHRVAEYQRH